MVAAGDAAAAAEEARLGLWLSGRQPRQPTAQQRSAVSELEHAGVNSGEVESVFGNVDYVRFRIQCPTTTVFGVAHAQMGSFLSWPEATPLGETRAGKV